MFDTAEGEDFQREDGSGDGSAKDCAETGGNARGEKHAGIFPGEFELFCHKLGEAAANLDSCAFAAGRSAEKVGDDGGDKDHWGHTGGHAATWFMDLIHDQVVTGFGIFAHEFIEGEDKDAGEWKEEEQPGMVEAEADGFVKQPEKKRYQGTRGQGDGDDEYRPAKEMGNDRKMF